MYCVTGIMQICHRVLPPSSLQGAALAELQALFPALAGTGSPAAKTEALLQLQHAAAACAAAFPTSLHTQCTM
jgi:hypothetical protein